MSVFDIEAREDRGAILQDIQLAVLARNAAKRRAMEAEEVAVGQRKIEKDADTRLRDLHAELEHAIARSIEAPLFDMRTRTWSGRWSDSDVLRDGPISMGPHSNKEMEDGWAAEATSSTSRSVKPKT